jgi:hypothetical protein
LAVRNTQVETELGGEYSKIFVNERAEGRITTWAHRISLAPLPPRPDNPPLP